MRSMPSIDHKDHIMDHDEAKEIVRAINYDPNGICSWKLTEGTRRKEGEICGNNSRRMIDFNYKKYYVKRIAFLFMENRILRTDEMVLCKDGDHMNCAFDNLYVETSHRNKQIHARTYYINKTGFPGIEKRIHKHSTSYRVIVRDQNHKRVNVGTYTDINEAIRARKIAEIKYEYPQLEPTLAL